MATGKIAQISSFEVLATNVVLFRTGQTRILVLNDYTVQSTSGNTNVGFTIPQADRPNSPVSGIGLRRNGSAYMCNGILGVSTNGSVQAYMAAQYNTDTGVSFAYSGDTYDGVAIWTI